MNDKDFVWLGIKLGFGAAMGFGIAYLLFRKVQ